ncbi:hypothetical protein Q7P35_009801 [Cladosporium inversicolor]
MRSEDFAMSVQKKSMRDARDADEDPSQGALHELGVVIFGVPVSRSNGGSGRITLLLGTVVEDQPLAEESSQCQLWEVQVVLVVEVEELAEQEDSSRSLDIARKVEGIEDEVEDEVGGAAAAAGMGDRRAVGGVGRKGMSMGVAAKAAVGSARRHAHGLRSAWRGRSRIDAQVDDLLVGTMRGCEGEEGQKREKDYYTILS